jgi:FMN phosphatase YigB (HAD superfamily)
MDTEGVLTTQIASVPVAGPQGLEISLGQHLQDARKKAGLTQQQLCQRAGLSYSTLAKIERGAIKSPSIFTIQQIAQVLAMPLDTLVGSQTGSPAPRPKRLSKSGVGFIFFDINGCLVRFFHRAFTQLAEETGASPDAIEAVFWRHNDAICKGQMSLDDFNGALAKHLNVDSVDWQKLYLDAVEPIKEMHELVRWAAGNYRVGLMSNTMPGFIDAMRSRGLIPDVPYTVVADSSQVGAVKPDPKIYEAAADQAGCPASEILLIDDSRANLVPAESLGWHVLWFDDYNPAEAIKRIRQVLELTS